MSVNRFYKRPQGLPRTPVKRHPEVSFACQLVGLGPTGPEETPAAKCSKNYFQIIFSLFSGSFYSQVVLDDPRCTVIARSSGFSASFGGVGA
jgi:hypothetical protein